MSTVELSCRGCGATWHRERRPGKPPAWCPSCVESGAQERYERERRKERRAAGGVSVQDRRVGSGGLAEQIAARNAVLHTACRTALGALRMGQLAAADEALARVVS